MKDGPQVGNPIYKVRYSKSSGREDREQLVGEVITIVRQQVILVCSVLLAKTGQQHTKYFSIVQFTDRSLRLLFWLITFEADWDGAAESELPTLARLCPVKACLLACCVPLEADLALPYLQSAVINAESNGGADALTGSGPIEAVNRNV